MTQPTLEEYVRARSDSLRSVRVRIASELVAQAEDVLRQSEHLTFDSALALLERLRSQEPANSGTRQQVSEALNSRMVNGQ